MIASDFSDEPVIDVRNLRQWFPVRRRLFDGFRAGQSVLKAVDDVSFTIRSGEVLGLVGESGSGKSTTGMTALKLYAPTGGEIHFRKLGLLNNENRQTRLAFRRDAQIVFQNPFEALNPRYTVEQSVLEPIKIHFPGDPALQRDMLLRAMTRAGLIPVENYLERFTHELSGGQLQRIAIARAIAVEPSFLVADEPVSMLDVSIRAGILNLLRFFARELKMAILYISHDLSTMRHVCTNIGVMYLGRIVEQGAANTILERPYHPYAQALIAAVPIIGSGTAKRARVELIGALPNPMNPPTGCRFHPRCPKVMPRCRNQEPVLKSVESGHHVACHLYS